MKRILFLLTVSILFVGCNVDTGTLWARYDWCGERTTQENATGICRMWWDLGSGVVTEDEFVNQVNEAWNVTSTAQAMPTVTPTRIPRPEYKPINIETPTPSFVKINSPLPTPTFVPYMPDASDYDNLLDWYFE